MPRKTKKFIEPIADTLENVAKCVVKSIVKSKESTDNAKNDGKLRISEITIKFKQEGED